MKPAYLAFIAVVCLCYGCEKKKNAAPSSVTTTTHPIDTTKVVITYPYTDTFYGVWMDDVFSFENYLPDPDTSFSVTVYVLHIDSVNVNVNSEITKYNDNASGSYSISAFDTLNYNYSFADTIGQSYMFKSSPAQKVTITNSFLFTSDSLYFGKTYQSHFWSESGSFAGKGNVHKH